MDRYDVVPVVHHAWNESFAHQDLNRVAIRNRGWGPLTYNCLDHPAVKKDKEDVRDDLDEREFNHIPDIRVLEINMVDGFAGTCIQKLIEY